jgi:hypothetical protein
MMLAASPTFFLLFSLFLKMFTYTFKKMDSELGTVEPDDKVTRLSTMDLSVKIERGGKKRIWRGGDMVAELSAVIRATNLGDEVCILAEPDLPSCWLLRFF